MNEFNDNDDVPGPLDIFATIAYAGAALIVVMVVIAMLAGLLTMSGCCSSCHRNVCPNGMCNGSGQ